MYAMESRCHVSVGKNVVSKETVTSYDNFPRSKNASVSWDLKSPFSFGNNLLVSGQQATDNQGLGEELMRNNVANNSSGGSWNRKYDGGKIINPFLVTLNAFSIDNDSTSRLSSSTVDSNFRGSSFIDKKLGKFGDPRGAQNPRIVQGTTIASSSESSMPPKRGRMGVNSHAAYCQVYGCHKDLSSSKEYHKRHKVCEVHSKTAKVVVNGIEQRFCQQCSRFHLLGEFDDGKRSCRKRLVGHNERRRKPQVGIRSGRTGTLQSYYGITGGRFQGTATMTTSFICQDILPCGLFHAENYGENNWCKRIKTEDDFTPLLTIPVAGGHLHSRTPFPSNSIEKLFPIFQDNGPNTPSGIFLAENKNRYPHDIGLPNSGSSLHHTPLGKEDFSASELATTIQGSSEITYSGCAFSLLSSQSQSSPSPSSGIPSMCQVPKLKGVCSQACRSGMLNRFSLTGMHSAGSNLISDRSDVVNFDITDGVYQGSHFLNGKDRLSCANDSTIDLLQLSSQLQRGECQNPWK